MEWTAQQEAIRCGDDSCATEIHVWRDAIEPGARWACAACGRKNEIILVVKCSPADRSGDEATDADEDEPYVAPAE